MDSDRKTPALRKLYYTIGEVTQLTGVPAHVLRYWEGEFPQLRPKKSRAGNRIYQQKDLEIISRIRSLLYERKYTIAGARVQLDSEEAAARGDGQSELIDEVRRELKDILSIMERNSGRGAAR
jgi:DNA-binding transcriptional MerR regulator